MSLEMQAVKAIFESTLNLNKFMDYLDQDRNIFNYDKINLNELSSGEKAALAWAKAIWSNEVDQNMIDLMTGFSLLDRNIKIAIIIALDLVHQISKPEDKMKDIPIINIIHRGKNVLN